MNLPPIQYGTCSICEHIIFRGSLCGLCADQQDNAQLVKQRRPIRSRSLVRPTRLAPTPISASHRERN